MRLRHRPAPWGEHTQLWAEYFAQAMGEIGIEVELVQNDAPGFLSGVYRDHDFDTATAGTSSGADPAVSTMVWLRSGLARGHALDQPVRLAVRRDGRDDRRGGVRARHRGARRDVPRDPAPGDGGDPRLFAIEHPFISVTSTKLHNHHNTPALELVVLVRPVDRAVGPGRGLRSGRGRGGPSTGGGPLRRTGGPVPIGGPHRAFGRPGGEGWARRAAGPWSRFGGEPPERIGAAPPRRPRHGSRPDLRRRSGRACARVACSARKTPSARVPAGIGTRALDRRRRSGSHLGVARSPRPGRHRRVARWPRPGRHRW